MDSSLARGRMQSQKQAVLSIHLYSYNSKQNKVHKMKKFVEKHVKKAKNKYYCKYFEQYKSDSRKQWSMLNNLLNRQRKISNFKKIIDDDGNTTTSPTRIAEIFNDYFVNIASKLKSNSSISNSMMQHLNYLHVMSQCKIQFI